MVSVSLCCKDHPLPLRPSVLSPSLSLSPSRSPPLSLSLSLVARGVKKRGVAQRNLGHTARPHPDHISLSDLSFQGRQQGLGRLVSLAAAQYAGQRYVRWAGAMSNPVNPTHGIPAGCPLANGMLHLFLTRAMRNTTDQVQETNLRTYADDWELFTQGLRRKVTQDIVGSFVTATDELRRTGIYGGQLFEISHPGLRKLRQNRPAPGCRRLRAPGGHPR